MRLIYALVAAICVAMLAAMITGCAPAPQNLVPGVVAQRTALDEKALAGAELAYETLRVAIETAADSGALKGPAGTRAAELDGQAYTALLAARAAYNAGNAPSYAAAIDQVLAAVALGDAAIKGN